MGQSADHKEQYVTQSTEFNFDSKMFPQTIFSYLKPCIQHPGDIFLWQSCYFVFYPIISLLLLPHFAITCQATASKKYNYHLCFLPPFTHYNRPLRKHMLSSALRFKRSCLLVVIGWVWSMLFFSFCSNYIAQQTLSNVLLFSCNPIGQLCWQPRWSFSDLRQLR